MGDGDQVRRLLGLPGALARSLALPDQGAALHLAQLESAAEELLATLWARSGAEAAGRAEVFVPAYEGGHPDHDALNAVAARLGARHPELTVYEFPLYHRNAFWLSVQGAPPPVPAHAYSLPPAPRPLLYELFTRRRFPWFRALVNDYLSDNS